MKNTKGNVFIGLLMVAVSILIVGNWWIKSNRAAIKNYELIEDRLDIKILEIKIIERRTKSKLNDMIRAMDDAILQIEEF